MKNKKFSKFTALNTKQMESIQGGTNINLGLAMTKIDWGLVITEAVGITAIFGAVQIVQVVGTHSSDCDQY